MKTSFQREKVIRCVENASTLELFFFLSFRTICIWKELSSEPEAFRKFRLCGKEEGWFILTRCRIKHAGKGEMLLKSIYLAPRGTISTCLFYFLVERSNIPRPISNKTTRLEHFYVIFSCLQIWYGFNTFKLQFSCFKVSKLE